MCFARLNTVMGFHIEPTSAAAAEAGVNSRLGSCCGHDASTPDAAGRYIESRALPIRTGQAGPGRSHQTDDLRYGTKSLPSRLAQFSFFDRIGWCDGVSSVA